MATIDTPTPTNSGRWQCPHCTAEYTSPFAASLCCDNDLETL